MLFILLYNFNNIPWISYCYALWPTNAQLFHKLSHSYMFRHYRLIFRELVINILSSYRNISNGAVRNIIYIINCIFSNTICIINCNTNSCIWNTFVTLRGIYCIDFIINCIFSNTICIINFITNSCTWNTFVSWQGIDCIDLYYKLYYQQMLLKYLCNFARYDYKLPEDDTIVSKHAGMC